MTNISIINESCIQVVKQSFRNCIVIIIEINTLFFKEIIIMQHFGINLDQCDIITVLSFLKVPSLYNDDEIVLLPVCVIRSLQDRFSSIKIHVLKCS